MRHRRRSLMLAALLAVLLVVCSASAHGSVEGSEAEPADPDEIGVDEKKMVEEKRPLVVAHRGASGAAPENTMAAFERAVEMGADMIELDVHATKDGHIVVIHDPVLNRTTTGSVRGSVVWFTLEQIKTLDAGSWKGPEFAGEEIPTLHEVLSAFKGRTRVLIEIKGKNIEDKVVDVIRETGTEEDVVIQSFDAEAVRRCRQLLPEVPAGVLFSAPLLFGRSSFNDKVISTALDVNADFVAVGHRAATPELISAAKENGLEVAVWTVNSSKDMSNMIDVGVDGIITNHPDVLIELIGE
ncbi:MAG: glycerophosphodiester phosphodiesterase family protein [Firmicutes bacterium]|jgi:glycerophosphoryl diester phosphodiesterase|nr:glycerophosphodiester phosphodiesterase family protein [Bacillota bacterium]MDD4793127.1 glycerophosphodiester phosphodiesterase family protein [Bacillota bacterium]